MSVSHETTAPFIVFGLPRSRTYWLSRFLTYRNWTCAHDEARHMRSIEDVKSWLSLDYVGCSETSAAPYWRLVRRFRPDARVVVVRRPVAEVVESLLATGIGFDRQVLTANLRHYDARLDQIAARVPGALSVTFDELKGEQACARLFEHCLPFPHDHDWWSRMAALRMVGDVPALLRYGTAFARQLARADASCRQEIRRMLWEDRKPPDMEGMTFQEEEFDDFFRDGQTLFSEHCVDVGETATQYLEKNLALIEKLADIGALQMMTARSNGRMFGYLMTVLGPSLEDPALNVATQTLFYASKDTKGLGLRLQRASIAALKARGGRWEVIQRAGVRGSGPKMGALYRRMGAQDHGQIYKLALEAA